MEFGGNSFEAQQEREKALTPQVGDRVCAMHCGVQKKGRVASADPETGLIGVTFSKHDAVVNLYNRSEVFLLYRYHQVAGMEVVTILCNQKQNV